MHDEQIAEPMFECKHFGWCVQVHYDAVFAKKPSLIDKPAQRRCEIYSCTAKSLQSTR